MRNGYKLGAHDATARLGILPCIVLHEAFYEHLCIWIALETFKELQTRLFYNCICLLSSIFTAEWWALSTSTYMDLDIGMALFPGSMFIDGKMNKDLKL